MFADLKFVLTHWRVIHLLGIATLRARYARSKFGQLWLSISTFIMILSIGTVWSLIWHMPVSTYLPFVGVGQIFYITLSQTINDSTGIFAADSRLYLNDRVPFLISVLAHLYRNGIIFLHNFPTIVLLILWSGTIHVTLSALYPLAILSAIFFLFCMTYIIATFCTYYRDLIQIVGLIMQVAFLLSPVMWKVEVIPEHYRPYIYANPFASFLEILRNPLIGMPVNDLAYYSALGWDVLLGVLMLIVYRFLNKNIIFWL